MDLALAVAAVEFLSMELDHPEKTHIGMRILGKVTEGVALKAVPASFLWRSIEVYR